MRARTIVFFLAWSACAAASDSDGALTLPPGVARTVTVPFAIAGVDVTDGDVVKIEKGKTSFRIVPRKNGMTDVVARDENGEKARFLVRVTDEEVARVAVQLEELLAGVPCLKVRTVGNAAVLAGEMDTPEDMARVIAAVDVIKTMPGPVTIHNLTRLSEPGKQRLAEKIEREIGNPEIVVRLLNNIALLEGVADSDFEADRAVELTKTFIFAPVRRLPAQDAKGGADTMPSMYNPNGLATTIVDMIRVRPRPGMGAGKPRPKK